MKALSIDTMRGFFTLEIMLAFALMTLVMGGVMLADFSSTYWVIASQTSNIGLSKTAARIEDMRAISKKDFYAATSSPLSTDMDATCAAGGLCYLVGSVSTDISSCSKHVQSSASWRVPGYSTSTVLLSTMLTSAPSAKALGGDCLLVPPAGTWGGIAAGREAVFSPGNPTAIDVLSGTAYVSGNQSPYLYIYRSGFVPYTNGFSASDPINALDVARDEASGRVYAYAAVASTTGQLAVINVTDIYNPVEVARVALNGVSPQGASPQGWRLTYYDHTVYIVTRNTAGPEFHMIDVSNPASPTELGSGLNLGTSAYGITVRDTLAADGSTKRYAYLATTLNQGEVMVLDVTNPQIPALAATLNLDDTGCGLSDKPDGTAVFLSGTVLYVGREHSTGSCPTLPDIYAISITDPLHPNVIASGVAGGGILGLRVSGGHLFVYASTQARPADTSLFDLDGDDIYAAQHAGNTVQIWDANPAHLVKITQKSLGGAQLQLFHSI